MVQATDSLIPTPALPARPPACREIFINPTKPLPIAQPIGTGWMPVIYHPERTVEYLRFERFPRKAKLTGAEALRYAAHTIHYRQIRKAEKRRRVEALAHPNYFRFLQAAE
jgi:hypothetical protein